MRLNRPFFKRRFKILGLRVSKHLAYLSFQKNNCLTLLSAQTRLELSRARTRLSEYYCYMFGRLKSYLFSAYCAVLDAIIEKKKLKKKAKNPHRQFWSYRKLCEFDEWSNSELRQFLAGELDLAKIRVQQCKNRFFVLLNDLTYVEKYVQRLCLLGIFPHRRKKRKRKQKQRRKLSN